MSKLTYQRESCSFIYKAINFCYTDKLGSGSLDPDSEGRSPSCTSSNMLSRSSNRNIDRLMPMQEKPLKTENLPMKRLSAPNRCTTTLTQG